MYKIEISERTLHFKQPAGTSRGVYTTRHSYYLTLTSDEMPGIEGVGECATLPDLSCDAKPEYAVTLRQVMPEITDEYAESVSDRYIELYEHIIGEKFVKAEGDEDIAKRIEKNVLAYLANK